MAENGRWVSNIKISILWRVDSLMWEYPWNEKNNTFTWLSSLYNPFNPLSTSLTKWSNTLKQFVGCCRRIVWVCLNVLWFGAKMISMSMNLTLSFQPAVLSLSSCFLRVWQRSLFYLSFCFCSVLPYSRKLTRFLEIRSDFIYLNFFNVDLIWTNVIKRSAYFICILFQCFSNKKRFTVTEKIAYIMSMIGVASTLG